MAEFPELNKMEAGSVQCRRELVIRACKTAHGRDWRRWEAFWSNFGELLRKAFSAASVLQVKL
jgi:hypothetical protein